ncbi:DUF2207 domain-containing protein [Streptomyces sp. AP-93]|uniref:DUF2207 family protein n=1 Tax=Streptomyces sp. AP-93 TaxID=2929048 RepID=UPI001FAF0A5E|nr:DUF2207 domain-containing protein [Streptomyces sp. AP-93]MCJ0874008.1 DUF2207 domain-containing protein [Streptomyces sp. AP-93]
MTWTWFVAAATLVSTLLWLSAFGWAVAATRPAPLAADGPTMELRPEPPALVEFLTGGWESGRGAPRATLLDLAARGFLALEQTGPDPRDTLVRIRPPRGKPTGATGTAGATGATGTAAEDLLPYEALVLARVTALASGGVLPVGALARGTEDEDRGWWRAFRRAVAADARSRGLARDRYPAPLKAGLTLAAVPPGALAAVLFVSLAGPGGWFMSLATGLAVWACGSVLVARLTGERETPAGTGACAHWLGVREWMARDESFPGLPPAAVAVWDRYVAYGAATGVARSALAVLPLGPRDERRAWSTYGGGWHEVRLRYAPAPARALRPPRDSVRLALRRAGSASIVLLLVAWWHTHPPGEIRLPVPSVPLLVVELVLLTGVLMGARWLWTGRRPVIPLAAYVYGGLLAFVGSTWGLQASGSWEVPPQAAWAQLPPVLITGPALLWYLFLLAAALLDLSRRAWSEGEVVRLRTGKQVRHLALDPGGRTTVTAWPVRSELYGALREGAVVRVLRGPVLGHVYDVVLVTPSPQGELFPAADPSELYDAQDSGSGEAPGLPGLTVPSALSTLLRRGDPEEFLPVAEAARILRAELRASDTLPGLGIRTYVTPDGRTALLLQTASGALGRRLLATHKRRAAPVGAGEADVAYARGRRLVLRRGEHVLMLELPHGADPSALPALAEAAARRMVSGSRPR